MMSWEPSPVSSPAAVPGGNLGDRGGEYSAHNTQLPAQDSMVPLLHPGAFATVGDVQLGGGVQDFLQRQEALCRLQEAELQRAMLSGATPAHPSLPYMQGVPLGMQAEYQVQTSNLHAMPEGYLPGQGPQIHPVDLASNFAQSIYQGFPFYTAMEPTTELPSVNPDSLAMDPTAGMGVGDPAAIGRFWVNPEDASGVAYGTPFAPYAAPALPPNEEAPMEYFQDGFAGDAPQSPPPVRAKKKERSKARILKPGELTLVVYGADEAIKWECRVLSFLQAVRGVLGERKFDPLQWRCSVLDSVVGAFLTQNVTDALSSKAFMTMVAQFPAPPPPSSKGTQDSDPGEREKTGATGAGTSIDSIDWTAVHAAPAEKVADAIRCRGMYNFLAKRIQGMLSRIGREGPVLPEFEVPQLPTPGRRTKRVAGKATPRRLTFAAQASSIALPSPSAAPSGSCLVVDPAAEPLQQCGVGLASELTHAGAMESLKVAATASPPSAGVCTTGSHPAESPTEAESPVQLDPIQHAAFPFSPLQSPAATSAAAQPLLPLPPAGQAPSDSFTWADASGSPQGDSQRDSLGVRAVGTTGGEGESGEVTAGDANPPGLSSAETQQAGDRDGSRGDGSDGTSAVEARVVEVREGGSVGPDGRQVALERSNGEASTSTEGEVDIGARLVDLEDLGAGGKPHSAAAGAQNPHPLDLEWLRDLDVEDVRRYLMSFEGLGQKSVSCVMLLALQKKSFPVDTNVGRICARLGWLPLDAEKALEDLDDYAPEPEVHQYLKDRLARFNIPVLYELHYHMITLGKVFCSKKDPNCNACPLSSMCEYAISNGRRRKAAPQPGWDSGESGEVDDGPGAQKAARGLPTLLLQSPADDPPAGREACQPVAGPMPPNDSPGYPGISSAPACDNPLVAFDAGLAVAKRKQAAVAMSCGGSCTEVDPERVRRGDGSADSTKHQPGPVVECQPPASTFPALETAEHCAERPAAATGDAAEHISVPQTSEGARGGESKGAAEANEALGVPSNGVCDGDPRHMDDEGKVDGVPPGVQSLEHAHLAGMEDIKESIPTETQERSPQGELQRILGCQARLSAALEEAGQAMEEAEDYAFSEGTSRILEASLEVMDLCSEGKEGARPQDSLATLKPGVARKRFLELSVLVHPDKNPSPQAEEAFSSLKTAYSQILELSARVAGAVPGLNGFPGEQADKAGRQVDICSNSMRLVLQAWEVPVEHSERFAGGIARHQGPLDCPLLLIAIPASVQTAAVDAETDAQTHHSPDGEPIQAPAPDPPPLEAPAAEASPSGASAAVPSSPPPLQPASALPPHAPCQPHRAAEGFPTAQPSPFQTDKSQSAEAPPSPSQDGGVAEIDTPPDTVLPSHSSSPETGLRPSSTWQDAGELAHPAASSAEKEPPCPEGPLSGHLQNSRATTSPDLRLRESQDEAHVVSGMETARSRGEDLDQPNAGFEGVGVPAAPGHEARQAAEQVEAAAAGAAFPPRPPCKFALLAHCRVAMKGRMALHGTYFQINEVFFCQGLATEGMMEVSEEEVEGWKQRKVLFGSSIGAITRGMTQLQVAHLFRSTCICVRAYNPASGMPHHLPAWLQPGGAIPKSGVPTRWRPKVPRVKAPKPPKLPRLPRPPKYAKAIGHPSDRIAANGLPMWGRTALRTKLVGRRPPRPEVCDEEDREGVALAAIKKRKRPLLQNGSSGLAVPGGASSTPEEASGNPKAPKRQQVFPISRAADRCGHCRSCLNRSMKKACFTRRAEAMLAMQQAVA